MAGRETASSVPQGTPTAVLGAGKVRYTTVAEAAQDATFGANRAGHPTTVARSEMKTWIVKFY